MNAIEISGLCKSYPGFSLDHINLSLPQGSIMGLVGENGAGKSTTIRLLMHAIAKDAGSIKVLGTDTDDPSYTERKQDIGVVLDEAYFPEMLNAKELNRIMRKTYRRWDEETFFRYLKNLALPLDKEFKDLSRGMRMKLAITVALSHEAQLLVLDEATSGLDPIIRDEILDVFNEFTRDENHSILLSSHIVSDLEKICDYIAFLHEGRMMFCEEKDRIMEDYAILKLRREELEVIPEEAIIRSRTSSYGADLLVHRAMVSQAFKAERASLEDIILMMVKGEEKR